MKLIRQINLDTHFAEVAKKAGIPADGPILKAERERMVAALQPVEGDQIWQYNDMGFLCGSAGWCVVRDGKVIRRHVVMMS